MNGCWGGLSVGQAYSFKVQNLSKVYSNAPVFHAALLYVNSNVLFVYTSKGMRKTLM